MNPAGATVSVPAVPPDDNAVMMSAPLVTGVTLPLAIGPAPVELLPLPI